MEQLTDTHLMVMGLAFLGTFLVVVLVGGAFIAVRTRQQNRSALPPPEPPPMTVDVVNATKDAHSPPPPVVRPPRPAPEPEHAAEVSAHLIDDPEPPTERGPPPKPRITLTPVDEPPRKTVAGAGLEPEDATERIAAPVPERPFLSTADLIDAEADSATVIIDRSQPTTHEYD